MFTLQLTGILYYHDEHENYPSGYTIYATVEKIVTRIFTFVDELDQDEFIRDINTKYYIRERKINKEYEDHFEELFGIRGAYSGYKIHINKIHNSSKPIIIDDILPHEIGYSKYHPFDSRYELKLLYS